MNANADSGTLTVILVVILPVAQMFSILLLIIFVRMCFRCLYAKYLQFSKCFLCRCFSSCHCCCCCCSPDDKTNGKHSSSTVKENKRKNIESKQEIKLGTIVNNGGNRVGDSSTIVEIPMRLINNNSSLRGHYQSAQEQDQCYVPESSKSFLSILPTIAASSTILPQPAAASSLSSSPSSAVQDIQFNDKICTNLNKFQTTALMHENINCASIINNNLNLKNSSTINQQCHGLMPSVSNANSTSQQNSLKYCLSSPKYKSIDYHHQISSNNVVSTANNKEFMINMNNVLSDADSLKENDDSDEDEARKCCELLNNDENEIIINGPIVNNVNVNDDCDNYSPMLMESASNCANEEQYNQYCFEMGKNSIANTTMASRTGPVSTNSKQQNFSKSIIKCLRTF